MSTIGNLKIDANEAKSKAMNIRTYANRVQEILEVISKAMNDIDNEGTNLYQGTSKSQELKEQLEIIKTNFEPIYNQIMAFANQIDATANSALNQ